MTANEIYKIAKSVKVTNAEYDALLVEIKRKATEGILCYNCSDDLSAETVAQLKFNGFQVWSKRFNDSDKGRSWTVTYINADRENQWSFDDDGERACRDYKHRISLPVAPKTRLPNVDAFV